MSWQSMRIETKCGAQSPRVVKRPPSCRRPIWRRERAREGGRRERNDQGAGQARRDGGMVIFDDWRSANHFRWVARQLRVFHNSSGIKSGKGARNHERAIALRYNFSLGATGHAEGECQDRQLRHGKLPRMYQKKNFASHLRAFA